MVNNIQNWCSIKTLQLPICSKSFTYNKPNLVHLWIFSCVAYYQVSLANINKLDSKVFCKLFIYYSEKNNLYYYYDLIKRKIVISIDVKFDEENYNLIVSLTKNLFMERNIDFFIFNQNTLSNNMIEKNIHICSKNLSSTKIFKQL